MCFDSSPRAAVVWFELSLSYINLNSKEKIIFTRQLLMDNATSMQRERIQLFHHSIHHTHPLLRKKSFMHVMLNICQKINMKCEKILHSPSSQLILPSIIIVAMICISVYQPNPPSISPSLSQCMCFIVTSSFISLLFLYIHLTLHHCEILFLNWSQHAFFAWWFTIFCRFFNWGSSFNYYVQF